MTVPISSPNFPHISSSFFFSSFSPLRTFSAFDPWLLDCFSIFSSPSFTVGASISWSRGFRCSVIPGSTPALSAMSSPVRANGLFSTRLNGTTESWIGCTACHINRSRKEEEMRRERNALSRSRCTYAKASWCPAEIPATKFEGWWDGQALCPMIGVAPPCAGRDLSRTPYEIWTTPPSHLHNFKFEICWQGRAGHECGSASGGRMGQHALTTLTPRLYSTAVMRLHPTMRRSQGLSSLLVELFVLSNFRCWTFGDRLSNWKPSTGNRCELLIWVQSSSLNSGSVVQNSNVNFVHVVTFSLIFWLWMCWVSFRVFAHTENVLSVKRLSCCSQSW